MRGVHNYFPEVRSQSNVNLSTDTSYNKVNFCMTYAMGKSYTLHGHKVTFLPE